MMLLRKQTVIASIKLALPVMTCGLLLTKLWCASKKRKERIERWFLQPAH
jgi:hypothetical protein